jgi:hypothetical protein
MDPVSSLLTAVTASAAVASFLRALYQVVSRLQRHKPGGSHSGAAEPHGGEQSTRPSDPDAPPAPARRPSEKSTSRRKRQGWDGVEAWGRRYPVALSLVMGFFFLGVTIFLAHSSAEAPQGPTGSITSPEDGAAVPYRVRVEGASKEVPLDTSPWLFVQANNGFLYPQGGGTGNAVEIDRGDGSWCGFAFFGEDAARSAGKSYSLVLALPTDRADRRLQRELEAGPPVPHWRNLPEGFDLLAPAIKVTRLVNSGSVDYGSCRP